jgi:hypothetical protein
VIVCLFLWEWSKKRFRFVVSSLSTFLGYTAWNLLQNATGADSALNIDRPLIPISWSDVGSGVAVFVATVIALGALTNRSEMAWKVLAASGIAGLIATLVDLFFL